MGEVLLTEPKQAKAAAHDLPLSSPVMSRSMTAACAWWSSLSTAEPETELLHSISTTWSVRNSLSVQ